MLKLLPTFFIALLTYGLQAQTDFLTLKKNDISIQTFMPGNYIKCQLNNDEWVQGYIRKIQNDSLYIKPFYEAVGVSSWGLIGTDSVFVDVIKISVKEITALPKKHQSFEYIKDGAIFEIGGGGYIFLNVVNSILSKSNVFAKNNVGQLGVAAGVAALGVILHLVHRTYIKLGGRYRLNYIQLNSPPNNS